MRVDRGEHNFHIENDLSRVLTRAIIRTREKKWDYVSIIAGIPGSGKSTFTQMIAKFCCPWFDKSYVAFNADKFIEITTTCPEFSSVILDESFEALYNKLSYSPDFIRIINHLQIIRQRHLYIFLCLPNFFDLSKGVAIFRSSHLFVTYSDDEDNRGFYLFFGREEKKALYVLGHKFMDYNAVKATFHGVFFNPHIIPDEEYEAMKLEHLKSQGTSKNRSKSERIAANRLRLLIIHLKSSKMMLQREIAAVLNTSEANIGMFLDAIKPEEHKWDEEMSKTMLKTPMPVSVRSNLRLKD